ncbi:hypothetical protein EDD18DRAFT_1355864 [Armillaria luteobubalina]|uniref:Uncharacterized protein n=1 Tax=Armillaria luteobubalina TaxID=153913 RepID=A0AA39UM92_9AGAR|nr:hypothetical protein EDD18DRAFT_1355864 [Armillaria luteobubalina]
MSDLSGANVDAAMESVRRIAYSAVCFTGLRIELQADLHPKLLHDNVIVAECTTSDTVIQESTMIKESDSTCWELAQNIKISTEFPSFKLSILSRYPGHDDHILAQAELHTASFISEIEICDHGDSQVLSHLHFCGSVLELGFRGVIVPSGPSSIPSSADGNSLFDLPTTNGQSGPDLSFNFRIGFPESLSDHGNHLLLHSTQFRSEDDLQNAILALERSLWYTPDSDPNKPSRLSDLCHAFKHRFEFLGDSRDLDQAIQFGDVLAVWRLNPSSAIVKYSIDSDKYIFTNRKIYGWIHSSRIIGNHAVTLADVDQDDQLFLFSDLSDSYFHRFDIMGNLDDLNSAVSAAKFAISISIQGSPSKASLLNTLARYLWLWFEWLGKLNDIESAIEMGWLAFSLAPEGDELRPWALYSTALSFFKRFNRLGKSDDLEESISKRRKALDSMPEDFPERYWMLSNLSFNLRYRFVLFDDPSDLDEAIVKGIDAVNAVSSKSPNRPGILNNLSICFSTRFDWNGDINDLTEPISLLQSALSNTPDGHYTKDANDIDEAVSAGWCAVACTPDGDPDKHICLHHLIESLQHCFIDHKNIDDLEESIACGKKILSLIPNGHLEKNHTLLHLGDSARLRFDHFQDPSDADTATSLYKSAALNLAGKPSDRLRAALQWAEMCITFNCPSALEAYKVALNVLPRVVWMGKSIAARHRQLADYGSAVNEAAAYALQLGYTDIALEWLEMGQAIVWGQLHNLCSPVDILSDAHPDLAERLSQVAAALEKATS